MSRQRGATQKSPEGTITGAPAETSEPCTGCANLNDYQIVALASRTGIPEREKIGRLIELDTRLGTLFNYRDSLHQALCWSQNPDLPRDPRVRPLETLVKTISRDLGPGVMDSFGRLVAAGRMDPDPSEIAQLLKIPDGKISHWLGKIEVRENEVYGLEVYKAALKAYVDNDQEALGPLIRSIFPFERHEVLKASHRKRPDFLYHGVKIQPGETPQSYVDKIESILARGILPSQPGHSNMDRNFRPVFSVLEPEHTHGILYFAIDLRKSDYCVFTNSTMHPAVEGIIYTKALREPMTLLADMRPAEVILGPGTINEINAHRTPEELAVFRAGVLEQLASRSISYESGKGQIGS